VVVPDTSVPDPADTGFRAHTNHLLLAQPQGGLGPKGGMSPQQFRGFYGTLASGDGAGTIALVGAYHYPTALADFNTFSTQFGLPTETSSNALASTNKVFQIVYANGSQPKTNGGWAQESALDIEWSHAMAPGAKIVLVEAGSNSFTDLMKAVDTARTLGVRQISMSWGGREFSGESTYDSHFPDGNGIVYFAASGDTGGATIYPSVSPRVVAVGGTHVDTNASGGLTGETGWSGSGGGVSLYEPKPAYQNVLTGASKRAVPDISADADPNTGVAVYDSTAYRGWSGWMVFGGTSASSPAMAGMVNLVGSRASWGATAELNLIYSQLGSTNYRDITSGTAGSFSCAPGWDYVTGVGTPQGLGGL
jgi:subtilase family serine protease